MYHQSALYYLAHAFSTTDLVEEPCHDVDAVGHPTRIYDQSTSQAWSQARSKALRTTEELLQRLLDHNPPPHEGDAIVSCSHPPNDSG